MKDARRTALQRNGFTFKQFFIAHDRCAMKVGTDAILLGAWTPVAGATRVLDIGSGSGILALMLAQRTADHVQIDAVERDAAAAAQAADNAAASPWAARVRVRQASIQEVARDSTVRYDLIVSNPPWFAPGVACATAARDSARATGDLDHPTLLACAEALIGEAGALCVVLPESEGTQFIAEAEARGWYLRDRMDVADNAMRLPHRVLLMLSPTPGEALSGRMVIRGDDQRYSEAFCSLTRDFYLFM
ncbi:methyltransferase [Pantoea sp. 1.19]|uniref:tRNA(1)(Val) (adenine(37)-N(6))-methyltransferase TrmN n=1 Tax=Pantoea sp. 1.19 TaxID=1925589 RepID=UPI0011153F1C